MFVAHDARDLVLVEVDLLRATEELRGRRHDDNDTWALASACCLDVFAIVDRNAL